MPNSATAALVCPPKIRVYHALYGYDSECCGHVIELDGKWIAEFRFEHPDGEDHRLFAESLAREVIGKYDPSCLPTIDWLSLDYSEVSDD